MGRENERTLRMKEEYIRLRKEGMTPPEIAKKFGLSRSTVYRKLPEIAASNNVTHDSLLQNPGCGNFGHGAGRFDPVKPVDTKAFTEEFKKLLSGMDTLLKTVSDTAESQEEIQKLIEEEEKAWN